MSPGRAEAMVAMAVAVASLAGCAGPATFVASEPPPETGVDAWFASPPAKVRGALAQSMIEEGFSVEPGASPKAVVGTKRQVPYVDEESVEPASGPIPFYALRAVIARDGETHVRLTVHPECASCDGTSLYEWEYPVDLMRDVVERSRKMLREKRPRVVYPPRYRPPHPRRVVPR